MIIIMTLFQPEVYFCLIFVNQTHIFLTLFTRIGNKIGHNRYQLSVYQLHLA